MKSSTFGLGLKQAKEQSVGIINIEGHAFADNLLVFHSLKKQTNKQTNKQKSGLQSTISVWVVLYTFLLVAPSIM